MLRITSLDEMACYDATMDKFEELSRHGYSLERLLNKIESDYTYSEEYTDWDYE